MKNVSYNVYVYFCFMTIASLFVCLHTLSVCVFLCFGPCCLL